MINHSQAFNYFGDKLKEFKDEFGFKFLDVNPCEITDKKGLIFIAKKAINEFLEEELIIVETRQEDPNKEIRVDFICNDQYHSLKIDPNTGFIDLSYSETFKFIGLLSGKIVTRINPSSGFVVGEEEEMRYAWKEGLPTHLFDPIFLFKNITGKRFKAEETKSVFKLHEFIDADEYKNKLVDSLNKYLEDHQRSFRFNHKQIKIYLDKEDSYRILLSGDYVGGFQEKPIALILRIIF